MDQLDTKILNLIQRGLPLSENPFHDLAKQLGIEPGQIIERLQQLKTAGFIRRIGGVFNTAKMGYQSTLIAMEVPVDQIITVSQIINKYPQVTHNYLRNNRMNIWFTLSTKSKAQKDQILNEIKCSCGQVKIHEFPAVKHFKLNVYFDLEGSHV
jgi:DNA-binding Lrp family transcriptional regulator